MSQQPIGEKEEKSDEKSNEKEMEKQEEKTPEEKSWEEKYHRDPLGSIIWALILIWVGVVFLLTNLGLLDDLLHFTVLIPGLGILDKFIGAWPIILIGMGALLLIEVLIRLLVPAYRRPVTGTLILAVVFIGLGLGDLINWNLLWPLILIALGLSFLMRGLLRPK
jgi:hypothetical protein